MKHKFILTKSKTAAGAEVYECDACGKKTILYDDQSECNTKGFTPWTRAARARNRKSIFQSFNKNIYDKRKG